MISFTVDIDFVDTGFRRITCKSFVAGGCSTDANQLPSDHARIFVGIHGSLWLVLRPVLRHLSKPAFQRCCSLAATALCQQNRYWQHRQRCRRSLHRQSPLRQVPRLVSHIAGQLDALHLPHNPPDSLPDTDAAGIGPSMKPAMGIPWRRNEPHKSRNRMHHLQSRECTPSRRRKKICVGHVAQGCRCQKAGERRKECCTGRRWISDRGHRRIGRRP